MTNKPQSKKSWKAIHMAITAVSVTATLAFWNVFASPAKPQPVVQLMDSTLPPPPPDPTETAQPTEVARPVPTVMSLQPVKIIYGGLAPIQQNVQIVTAAPAPVYAPAPAPAKKHRNGGGGGSSAPAASSGSSKP